MNPFALNHETTKAVIFDMNGTIIDDGPYHLSAFEVFFKKHSLPITLEEYQRRFHARRNEEFMPELFGREVSPEEIQQLSHEKEQIYQDLYAPYVTEIAGFSDLVWYLKEKGIKVGLATSSAQMNVDFTVQHLHLENTFDAITCGDEVVHSKPDPSIYLLTAEKLGVEPEQCLVFEDSPIGVQAAKAAGMTVIGMLTSKTAEELGVPGMHSFTEFTV